jgi:hypothetical protein
VHPQRSPFQQRSIPPSAGNETLPNINFSLPHLRTGSFLVPHSALTES